MTLDIVAPPMCFPDDIAAGSMEGNAAKTNVTMINTDNEYLVEVESTAPMTRNTELEAETVLIIEMF
jgi:hypothetical protein